MTTYTHNTVLTPEKVLLAANSALRASGNPELAMVEVVSGDGDFPLGATGKSLVVYLADRSSKKLATSAALA